MAMSQSTPESHLRVEVRCIPSVDLVFQARAHNALDLVGTGRPEWVAASLKSVLLQWYPSVSVVLIEPIATEHGEQVWYAYRDGQETSLEVAADQRSADRLQGPR